MLSSIQQGIQSGHASMELVNKYMVSEGWQNGYAEQVAEWVQHHKTIICLNGGAYADVCEWLEFFERGEADGHHTLPFTGFSEEAAQGGNLTSVAVILPQRIFETRDLLRRAKRDESITWAYDYKLRELRVGWTDEDGIVRHHVISEWEKELIDRLDRTGFAR
jgi:hypothetical protein